MDTTSRSTLNAQKVGSATVNDLQAMVEEAARTSGAAGVQVSVIVGEERADLVYGNANTELNIPMTVATVTQIGSVTKVFNAAMILTLVEEGRLELDMPVSAYLPNLELADQQAQATITLRQLLSMSSGLDNGPHAPFNGEDGLARYVTLTRTLPQHFVPGKGFGYSSAGICIAGYVAQQTAGSSWDTLIKQRIFEPAGLLQTVTLPQNFPYYRVSLGYTPTPQGPQVNRPWFLTQGEAPAGGTLLTSAHNLASFGQIFVNGGKTANGHQVLSDVAVQMMTTPTTDVPVAIPTWGVGEKWGLGPSMSKWGDRIVWGHAGSNQNGAAQLLWMPEQHAVLAFVLNTPASLDAFSVQLFDRFSDAVFGVTAPKLVVPTPPLRVDNPARFVGSYARLGMRYEISEQADGLHYKQINVGGIVPAEVMPLGVMLDAKLTSLGGDRFLVTMPGQQGGLPIGVFGNDSQGRATNLVDPMFAAHRTHEASA